jgi:hypothetical protein
MDGNPLVIKSGPNAGQPRKKFFMALAVPKTDPGAAGLIRTIEAAAMAGFPSLFAAGEPADFAYKYKDGDSAKPDASGKAPRDREGYPGNWVFEFSGGYESKCFTAGGAAALTEMDAIKTGDYIRISGSVSANGSSARPGVYLNHNMVELVGYGDAISNAPDASQVFGAAPAALPPGASATPVAPETAPAPTVPQPAGTAPPPHTGFLDAPPPPPAAAPAPARYIVNGHEYTEEALRASGYTDANLAALPRA